MKAHFLLTLFVLTSFQSLWMAHPAEAGQMRIVAVVNDEVITEAELDRAVAPAYLQMQATYEPEELVEKAKEMKGQVLQQIIEERLMLQEARKPRPIEVGKGKIGTPPPIQVSEEEVERMLANARTKFDTPETFADTLAQQGLTVDDLKTRFRDQITIQKLIDRQIRSRITISPSEVTAYYQEHKEEFKAPLGAQVAVLLIKPKDGLDLGQARELAESLRRQVEAGADFYEIVKRYSDGPNPNMGGRVGLLEKGKGRKEIEQTLFSTKPGEITPVIKTPAGFYVFRVEAIRPERMAELDEVKDHVQDKLYQQRGESLYQEWIAKLKQNAYIQISS